jgi:hypothetical protein
MVFAIQLIIAVFIALMLSGLLVLVLAPDRRDDGIAVYAGVMAIIWFVTVAIGAWMIPFGPLAFGVPWLGLLMVGVLVLVIAAAPARSWRVGASAAGDADTGARSTAAFGVVFWILIAIALAIVWLTTAL